jgi:UDP-4-amino-4-deoxy-L-arabinose formyltransferase/UDP-glucuronic acid dehydrogenase (UDP-4-keto-hexauronic acid decarboxylating)
MKYVAIGRGDFLYNTIVYLQSIDHELIGIVTDTGAAEYKKQTEDFQQLAHQLNAPFTITSSNEKISEFLSKLPQFQIGVSGNHRRIISKQVIEKFEYGLLNLHGGDLPRYRGNACQAWAILNGESRIAACVHKMISDELDAGYIIARSYLDINENTKIGETWRWLIDVAPKLFATSLNELERDPNYYLVNSKEIEVRSHRCHERRPEDGKIDWKNSALEISRLVNASGKPYFGAYTYLNGKVLKITDARLGIPVEDISAIPGQVVFIGNDSVSIACGVGILDVLSIEYEGKELNPISILKSTRIRLGSPE